MAKRFDLKGSYAGQWYKVNKRKFIFFPNGGSWFVFFWSFEDLSLCILCHLTEDDPLKSKHFATLKIQRVLFVFYFIIL